MDGLEATLASWLTSINDESLKGIPAEAVVSALVSLSCARFDVISFNISTI